MTEADARWETLHADDCFILKRWSRFLVAELMGEHLTLSTSVRNGGQTRSVRYLVNHQSCEATMHKGRYDLLHAMGQDAYHDVVCGEIGLPETEIVLMGTAANMNYAAVVVIADEAAESDRRGYSGRAGQCKLRGRSSGLAGGRSRLAKGERHHQYDGADQSPCYRGRSGSLRRYNDRSQIDSATEIGRSKPILRRPCYGDGHGSIRNRCARPKARSR